MFVFFLNFSLDDDYAMMFLYHRKMRYSKLIKCILDTQVKEGVLIYKVCDVDTKRTGNDLV